MTSQFEIVPASVAMVALLNVHPSRVADLRAPDELRAEPAAEMDSLLIASGIAACGLLLSARRAPVEQLDFGLRLGVSPIPRPLMRAKFPFRNCHTRSCGICTTAVTARLTGSRPSHWSCLAQAPPGFSRVQAVCDWVHTRVSFGYQHARPTKTALDVYTERFGYAGIFSILL